MRVVAVPLMSYPLRADGYSPVLGNDASFALPIEFADNSAQYINYAYAVPLRVRR